MSNPNFVIFYVEKPAASAAFYSALLQRPPVESSPNFALFALDSGLMLGLWSRYTVEPAAAGRGGASELAFAVADADAVDQRHADWSLRGLPILQAPTDLDFGRTFVALDPDGHRLRVFSRGAQVTADRCLNAGVSQARLSSTSFRISTASQTSA